MSNPMNDFFRTLGMAPPWSLRDLGTPLGEWPTPAQIDGCIVALERMLAAERGEAGE